MDATRPEPVQTTTARRLRRVRETGTDTVAVLAVTETVSWGVLYYAFAVVLDPMEREFGWTRVQTTFAFSLALLTAAIAGVAVGRWLDHHGPRTLMTLGSLGGAMLVFAWSRVTGLAALYLIWVGIGVSMAAVLYDPAFTVVTKWFGARRQWALTVITLAAGLASTVFSPLTAWLTSVAGWRGALSVLAGILMIVTVPLHGLLLRGPSARSTVPTHREPAAAREGGGRYVTAREAFGSISFWLLTTAFFLGTFNTAAIGVHLVVYLIGRGYDIGLAATVAGLVGIMQVVGRIVFGPLMTYLPHRWAVVALFLFQAAGLVLLARPQGFAVVVGFAVLFGMGNGMTTLARPMLLAEAYGPPNFGAIAGLAGMFATGGRAVAPVVASLAFAAAGSYAPLLWGLTGGAILAAAAGYLSVRCAEAENVTREAAPAA